MNVPLLKPLPTPPRDCVCDCGLRAARLMPRLLTAGALSSSEIVLNFRNAASAWHFSHTQLPG